MKYPQNMWIVPYRNSQCHNVLMKINNYPGAIIDNPGYICTRSDNRIERSWPCHLTLRLRKLVAIECNQRTHISTTTRGYCLRHYLTLCNLWLEMATMNRWVGAGKRGRVGRGRYGTGAKWKTRSLWKYVNESRWWRHGRRNTPEQTTTIINTGARLVDFRTSVITATKFVCQSVNNSTRPCTMDLQCTLTVLRATWLSGGASTVI